MRDDSCPGLSVEGYRPTETKPGGFLGLQCFGGSGADDPAFPLRHRCRDVGHQFAGRGGGVHIDIEGNHSPTIAASA